MLSIHDQHHEYAMLGLLGSANSKITTRYQIVRRRDMTIALGIQRHVPTNRRIEVADEVSSAVFS